MSEQEELAQEWLPTPLSRWVAKGTATIAPASLFLPEFLQKIGLQADWIATPSIRLLFLTITLCFGSFVLLILMLRHIKYLNTEIATKSEQPRINVLNRLESDCEKVLSAFISNKRLYETQLENILSMNKDRVTFHLTELNVMVN